MIKFRGIAIRRDDHKLVVSNVPEEWHLNLKMVGVSLSLFELGLALLGIYAALIGIPFSLPIITFGLAILIFVELGRPDIEIKYNTSFTSPPMTMGPGGRIRWEYEPPIEMVRWTYLDEEENPIPDEELGLYGSETVELEIPEGNRQALGESGEAMFSIGLPYPVKTIKFSGEDTEYEYDDLEGGEKLEGQDEIEQALVRDEASISFVVPCKELLSLGRIFQATAADDSKSIELVTTEEKIEFRYSQDTYAHTLDVLKDELEAGNQYHVILEWQPGELNMHIGPVNQNQATQSK